MSGYVNAPLRRLAERDEPPSKEEIRKAINGQYDMFVKFLTGVGNDNWHLIVTGPPGCGKTQFTSQVLERMDNVDVHKLSGTLSAVMLYSHLLQYQKKGQVTIIDDTDKIFEDTECLEILKAALDGHSGKAVDWSKYSTALSKTDTPTSFVYEGRCILLTNQILRFHSADKDPTKIQQRVAPLVSRCNYFRAGLPNRVWEIEALKLFMEHDQILVFSEGNTPQPVREEIINFIEESPENFREVSFRTVKHMLGLYESDPDDWKDMSIASFSY